MKAPLTTQTKYVSVILGSKKEPLPNRGKDFFYSRLETYCSEACEIYGFIIHDKDVDEETKQTKFLHIHCALIMKNAKQRLSTIMNALGEELEISNTCIQIDKMTSKNGSFKYLIHKGYENKHQYPVNEIKTNLPQDELDCILNSDDDTMNITYLIDVVKSSNGSKIEIAKKIGLTYYHMYRNTINDIIEEIRWEKRRAKILSTFPKDGIIS